MTENLTRMLEAVPVVPLVQADDPAVAVTTSRALAKGGLKVVEVVLRTEAALDCLRAIASEVPEMVAGAGTVLDASQAADAIVAGARFVVSPGLDRETVLLCQERSIPVYPGTATPSEVMTARNLGLEVVKFFPASLAGGVPMLKALSSVFRTMRFMPTGGVGIDNLGEFLALPGVLACGGSWLTPAGAVESGDFDTVTRLAEEAITLARRARGG